MQNCFMLTVFMIILTAGCTTTLDENLMPGLQIKVNGDDQYLMGMNLFEISPKNQDGTINMIVEVPAGSNQIWMIEKDGMLHRQRIKGRYVYLDYLPYPANYGVIPSEIDPNKPLKRVLALGPAQRVGELVKIRPIAVIKTLHKAQHEEVILAVLHEETLNPDQLGQLGFYRLSNLKSLNREYPGVLTILKEFLKRYKKPFDNNQDVQVLEVMDIHK